MNSLLLLALTLNAAYGVPQIRREESQDERPVSAAKFHVDIYSHPKTTFSCDGKQAGEYYADPEAKCAIYFICLGNVNGGLSALSFACPNGTLFQQATRVCSPEDQVFCSLATRFYDSVNGHIDSKGKDSKTLSGSSGIHTQSWVSNQKQRQEQKRPSAAHVQPIALQSQMLPDTRSKQLKGSLAGGLPSRIPPPKVLSISPPSVRKVPKSVFSIPTATKKPEPRDYEDPAEEALEYENTSSARNQ